ncbi:MAG: hypothetical protein R3E01_06850 [Pirellulaceae bacterium]|nr:hypothetical protein [Planctomycetales bacterium]
MMTTRDELLRRAELYAQRHGLVLGEQLGFGVHGIVLVAKNQTDPGRFALKIHEREPAFQRERDVYLRLRDRAVREIRGCHVPQLLRYDEALWVIEMEVVTRPFVLDFAGAYLDKPPDYTTEVLADWRAEKQEQFGDRWPEIELILASLERYGHLHGRRITWQHCVGIVTLSGELPRLTDRGPIEACSLSVATDVQRTFRG